MATQSQIHANRLNAQESTGPKSPSLASGPVPEVATEQDKIPTPNKPQIPVGAPPCGRPNPPSRNEPKILSAVPIYRGCTSGPIRPQHPVSGIKNPESYPSYHPTKPLPRKTNPISKTQEPTQPLLLQRITNKNHPYHTRKNKPNQTQSHIERSEIPISHRDPRQNPSR